MTRTGSNRAMARISAGLLVSLAATTVALYLAREATGAQGNGMTTANSVRGKELYTKICIPCHGEVAEGKRELMSPALHQQEGWYIISQLQKFREGHRGADPNDTSGALMRPMALVLPDEQAILDVTAYIKTLKGPAPKPEVKGDPKAGAGQYAIVCAACHGKNGEGNPDLKTPALAGQNDWYVVAQLEKFKKGYRGSDPKDITGLQMKGMAGTLTTDQAVRDVAAYIATLSK